MWGKESDGETKRRDVAMRAGVAKVEKLPDHY